MVADGAEGPLLVVGGEISTETVRSVLIGVESWLEGENH